MKVVALISGGKDSCYNMMQCISEGHQIVALANLKPADKDELDSYMYQTVGHHAIDLYAEAMGLPLYRRVIQGDSLQQGRIYNTTQEDEVEDLTALLTQIRGEIQFDGVSVGAILSDYQRVRVEHVCGRLGVTSLAYLWRRDQAELLQEMIDCGVKAVLIKVAALGLTPEKHLGRSLEEIYPHMLQMRDKYGLNPCGEGGEYETFTLDCPLFSKKIVIDCQQTVVHSEDAFAPVAYLNFTEMHLEDKQQENGISLTEKLKHLSMKRSSDILDEIGCHNSSDATVVAKESLEKEDSCVQCSLNRALWQYEHVRQEWVTITGIVGLKTDGQTVEEQTKVAMEMLQESLQKYQLQTSDIVCVCLLVSNMAEFGKVNSIYKTYFGQNPPIRVCVEVRLPVGVALQLDCLAQTCQSSRQTMHVQGISHWAPANIGPYSQSVKVGRLIYIAGQIALVPGSMCLVAGGIVPQTRLSLRHVERVLQAMASDCDMRCVRLAVCYVTDTRYIDIGKAEWTKYTEQRGGSVQTLCQFVVVPRLPRDAFIEWQVYAWQGDVHHVEEYRSTCKKSSLSASCVSQVSASESSDICISLKASVACDTPNPVIDDHTVLKLCLEVLHKSLSELQHQTSHQDHVTDHVTGLRIFYSTQFFKDGGIFAEYQSAWREVFGEVSILPPAFVPVRALEDNQILSMCH